MKKTALLVLFIFIMSLIACRPAQKHENDSALNGRLIISGAWALYPLAVSWAEEFKEIHPGVKIEISAGGAGKGMADVLSGLVDLAMVSREIYPQEMEQGAFFIPVAVDAVVPTVNHGNPVLGVLKEKGMKKDIFLRLWIKGEKLDWGLIYGQGTVGEINIYTRSDACGAAATFAAFLDKMQEDLQGTGIYGDPGMVTAVRDDRLGIGYNNINFVYDKDTRCPVEGVDVIPVDLNENGILDESENFYSTLDLMVNAVSEGRYPAPPARELYFVSKGKPPEGLAKEFLIYVLAQGQQLNLEAGYVSISEDKIKLALDKLR